MRARRPRRSSRGRRSPWRRRLGAAPPERTGGSREGHGVSVFQVAIAWLLAKSPAMLPIPGTSSVPHLEENVAAARLQLSPDELAALG